MFDFIYVHLARREKWKLYIVASERPHIVGSDWLVILKLNWTESFKVYNDGSTLNVVISPNIQTELSKLTAKYKNVFDKFAATIRDMQVDLALRKTFECPLSRGRTKLFLCEDENK
uniref:Uncharacterized protein n=1 Tax=Glossina pallidipes TaxID=7398 RepID=A0A1A9ZUV6_GLOPL